MVMSPPSQELTPTLKTKITRKQTAITHPRVMFSTEVTLMDEEGKMSLYRMPEEEEETVTDMM